MIFLDTEHDLPLCAHAFVDEPNSCFSNLNLRELVLHKLYCKYQLCHFSSALAKSVKREQRLFLSQNVSVVQCSGGNQPCSVPEVESCSQRWTCFGMSIEFSYWISYTYRMNSVNKEDVCFEKVEILRVLHRSYRG